jgi:hypothetical protein
MGNIEQGRLLPSLFSANLKKHTARRAHAKIFSAQRTLRLENPVKIMYHQSISSGIFNFGQGILITNALLYL